jgi:hypothetical protein
MGLAGMAFALLGADVALTDTTDAVMALLRRNVDTNMTTAALKLKDAEWAVGVTGKVSVAELDWANKSHYDALNPPFDYVIAADCVYSEIAVPHFLNAVQSMAGPKSCVVVCNEFRSQTVNDIFMAEFSKHFSIKKVPMNKMESEYQHPLIHIYIMKRLKKKGGVGVGGGSEEVEVDVEEDVELEGNRGTKGCQIDPDRQFEALAGPSEEEEGEVSIKIKEAIALEKPEALEKKEESEKFAARRQGAALAQQLRDVKLHDTL